MRIPAQAHTTSSEPSSTPNSTHTSTHTCTGRLRQEAEASFLSVKKRKKEKIAQLPRNPEFVACAGNSAGVLRVAACCGSHAVLEPRGARQQLHFSRGREQDIALTQSLTTQRPEAKWG